MKYKEDKIDSNMTFETKWKSHLTEYLSNISKGDGRTNGLYRKTNGNKGEVRYGYIIDVKEGEDQIELIKKYNLLTGKEDFKALVGDPHTYAHHMNSSQVMCYNFFRPMLERVDKDMIGYFGRPNNILVALVKKITGKTINPSSAKCRFEYKDNSTKYVFVKASPRGRGEVSSFDFFIDDGLVQIYFEIKYTEKGFGGWTESKDKSKASIENHNSYLRSGYSEMINDSVVIPDQNKILLKENNILFNKFYQLFRNVLKVNSDNTFSVFIFPKANKSVCGEFSRFSSHIELFGESMKNVSTVYWEDLGNYMSEDFKDKYINYLK